MIPECREHLRRVSAAGQCALVLLGIAWAWFERPAPVIYIIWKAGLTPAARQRAEADLGLRNPQPSNDSLEYELWVPTTGSVSAILRHQDVAYVGRIDHQTASIGSDAGHGRTRVWWAGPLSGARSPGRFRWLFGLTALATLISSWLSSPRSVARLPILVRQLRR